MQAPRRVGFTHGTGPTLLILALVTSLVPDAARAIQQPADTVFEVWEASVEEIRRALDGGRVTSVQLVDAYLARIAAYDTAGPRLNTIVRLNPGASAEAAVLDRERESTGPRGPLHGVPVLIKDNFDMQNLPTSAGSIALAGMVPPDDAFQVRKLRAAGAIILGKTNLHELASGITTISSLGGQTLNPYDPARNPGGSSGGTGAAIAASFAAIGWGTDTCGSIRIPAAHNNLFGLRPTKGLSSIDGIVPLSHTQDVAGPLARTITDLAIGLDATVGPDPADTATSVLEQQTVPRFVEALDANALRGARIGILESMFGDETDDGEVLTIVRAAIDTMETLGADIVTIRSETVDSMLRGSGLIDHEFKFDLGDYLAGVPGTFIRSLDDILRTGLYHASLATRLRRRNAAEERETGASRAARERRANLQSALRRLLDDERLDAIVYPTMRRRPARIGEPQAGSTCSLSANTGFPALSMPAGFTEDGLPIAIELLGRPFDDARLVSFGFAWEQAVRPRRPPPATPALVDGKAPAPLRAAVSAGAGAGEMKGEFVFHAGSNALEYSVTVEGEAAEGMFAIVLLQVEPGVREGPVIHRLGGPGQSTVTGRVTLEWAQREAFLEGRIVLVALSRTDPAGATRVALLPGR